MLCKILFYIPHAIICYFASRISNVSLAMYERLKISNNAFRTFFSFLESLLCLTFSLRTIFVSYGQKLKLEDPAKCRGFEDDLLDRVDPVPVHSTSILGTFSNKICSFWPVNVLIKQVDVMLEFIELCVKNQHILRAYVASLRNHLVRIGQNVTRMQINKKPTYERIVLQAKRRLPVITRGKKWLVLLGISASPVLQTNQSMESLKQIVQLTQCKKEVSKRDHSEVSDDDYDSDYQSEDIKQYHHFEKQLHVKSEDGAETDITALSTFLNSSFNANMTSFVTTSDDSITYERDRSLEEDLQITSSLVMEEVVDKNASSPIDDRRRHQELRSDIK